MKGPEVKVNNGWIDRIGHFVKEVQETELPYGMRGFIKIKSIFDKYRVASTGTAANPGYICIIRRGNYLRFGFSRRPKEKVIGFSGAKHKYELVWYSYTENMLKSKTEALEYFSEYRVIGEWLRISPHMAITYFKRNQND